MAGSTRPRAGKIIDNLGVTLAPITSKHGLAVVLVYALARKDKSNSPSRRAYIRHTEKGVGELDSFIVSCDEFDMPDFPAVLVKPAASPPHNPLFAAKLSCVQRREGLAVRSGSKPGLSHHQRASFLEVGLFRGCISKSDHEFVESKHLGCHA